MTKIEILREWQTKMQALEARMAELMALTSAVDSPLNEAIWAVQQAYTAAIAELVGDEELWLEWWWHECDLGNDPQQASSASGEPLAMIDTIEKLAALIG